MVLSGIAKFYAIYFSLQALANEESIHISLPSMAGALSIVLFSLLMRIYDELKDADADIRLGRAGLFWREASYALASGIEQILG